jgi:hypothetical protein
MNIAVRFTVKRGVHIERAMYGQQQILIDSNTNLAEGLGFEPWKGLHL